MFAHTQLRWLVLLALTCMFTATVTADNPLIVPIASPPELQYSLLGGNLGLLGLFDALSFYSYVNELSFLSSVGDLKECDKHLYLRQTDNHRDVIFKVADLNGQVTQLQSLTDDTVIINGNFTSFNNHTIKSPIILNVTNNNYTSIVPSNLTGSVNTFFVDQSLIYLGGDFEFNNTRGAAIYNLDTNSLHSTPFRGFGEDSVVNAITKISENDDDHIDEGSIIFGGRFNTLGFPELLIHNSSHSNHTKSNLTNSSLINAEQIISLKNGIFTNVNSDGHTPDSDLICPLNGDVKWSLNDREGGQWAVELPDEMKGLSPTKARIYVPSGDDGVKTFRIYSYPNNGIMNLSYVDPSTNSIAYCDAWCPLLTLDQLNNASTTNAESVANTTETQDELNSNVTFIDENGSFAMYYDPSTKTKTLGYGANYQEFSFENSISIDKVGLTIVDWYGSKGVLAGFELFSNAITVYGNETLNEPNCQGDDVDDGLNNYANIELGSFVSVKSLKLQVTSNDYLVSTDTDAKITLYPNISYSGNYSLIITTPGCVADDSCSQRPIVNATVIGSNDEILSTNIIYQNNDYMKFDYLYYGHFNGTIDSEDDFVSNSDHNGKNRIEISYDRSISPNQDSPFMVVDKVIANIVSLDNYYDFNNTNSTRRRNLSNLTYIDLNGLFEYSLNNFSFFDPNLVSSKIDNHTVISPNNTFVGNSTINTISGSLADNSSIGSILLTDSGKRLILRGNFSSVTSNLTLPSDDIFAFQLSDYNTTANETTGEVSSLRKRDDTQGFDLNGVVFNNTVTEIKPIADGVLFLGAFQVQNTNSSIEFHNLANKNNSVKTINNFALYLNDGKWYGFGNDYKDFEFDQFTNVTVAESDYYIFSSSSSNTLYNIWLQSNNSWVTDTTRQFKINQAVKLNPSQQILAGDSFNTMELYSKDQAAVDNTGNFTTFNFTVGTGNFSIDKSYYVNKSLSIVAGNFKTLNVSKVGFVDSHGSLSPLSGNIKWGNDSNIQSLYVDSDAKYLFVGYNGSVTVDNDTLGSGIFIYNLANNTVSSFQPPQLSTDDNSPVAVNTIVLYDKSLQLLVGGEFDKAGSLSCGTLCIYDISNTRWIDPLSVASSSTPFSGIATDIRFYQNNEVIISGNLTLNNDAVNFITYNFDNGDLGTNAALNNLGSSKFIQKFIVNDQDNSDLNGRFIAIGPGFISGFNGSAWSSIDSEIVYTVETKLDDLKLLDLAKANHNNTQEYFDNSNVLIVAGKFNLRDYGLTNLAFFNGTNWQPYVFTSFNNNQLGEIKSILIKDDYRFTSPDDINKASNHLSRGKVVGISLACALGSTTLLGLLYIIPYFALFRKLYSDTQDQRIQEKEMIGAVNPEDLLHEIDIQRNT